MHWSDLFCLLCVGNNLPGHNVTKYITIMPDFPHITFESPPGFFTQ